MIKFDIINVIETIVIVILFYDFFVLLHLCE